MAQVQREKRLHCAAHVASVSAITIRTSGTLEPFTTDPEQGFNCSHNMYIYIYLSLSLSVCVFVCGPDFVHRCYVTHTHTLSLSEIKKI